MTDEEVFGPIDFILVEFPSDADTSAAAAAIRDLVASDTIRIYDIMVVRKALDGSVSGMDMTDVTSQGVGAFAAFAGARSGLLGDEDLQQAADAMEPGTAAALVVFENAWARPFVKAAWQAGGQMIATARIPAQDVLAALEALESAS